MDSPLSQFLKKYSTLTSPKKKIREAVQTAVRERLHIEISTTAITCDKKIVFLSVHPAIKQRVREHEQEILAYVEELLKQKTVEAIR